MRLFEIQTLSENGRLADYSRLSDPVTVITAGIGLLTQLFPNIFGGGRRRLTQQDWMKLFPGNGFWTVKLRNRLSQTIHWNTDLNNIPEFTNYFIDENKAEICGGTCSFQEAFQRFTQLIEQEKFSGGTQPVGKYPGGWGVNTLNMNQLLLIGGGVLLVMALTKNKKRK